MLMGRAPRTVFVTIYSLLILLSFFCGIFFPIPPLFGTGLFPSFLVRIVCDARFWGSVVFSCISAVATSFVSVFSFVMRADVVL